MKVEIINGRWNFGSMVGLPIVVDIWFNCHRKIEKTPKRSKINKDNNYIFPVR